MAAGRPLWRRGFDRAERAVGRPLEQLVATPAFTDVLVGTFRLQRAAYGLFQRETRAVLHFFNVPARSDVSRLARQIGELSAQVTELTTMIEDQQRAEQRPRRAGSRRDGDGDAARRRTASS